MNRRTLGRLVVLVLLAAVLIAWFALDLGAYLSFDALNANKVRLQAFVAEHPATSVGLFMAAYVAVAAFSLPVATAMSLLSGALFGRWFGTLWVDIAATTGATLACVAARYLLRDWVQARFQGERLQAINRGIAENGLNFLLFLRLIPLFPFFLINLAAGLTVLPMRTFFIGTLVGILPGAFLYVNAGHAVSTIAKPADLLSTGILLSFGLLGLFALVPVVYKRWKQRREARASG